MIITKTIAAITLAAALLAGGGPQSCQRQGAPSGSSGNPAAPPGAVPACDTHPQPPHVIIFQGKKSVEGSTESECDLPPYEHHVQVFLETYSAGQWSVQPDPKGQTAGNCLDIPSAAAPKTCSWIITRCVKGTWRTRVVVFGYGPPTEGHPLGIPFNFPGPGQPPVVSSTVKLTC